jgi:hypothetical protein
MLALENTLFRQPCSTVHAMAEYLHDPVNWERNWVACGCCLPEGFKSYAPKTDVTIGGSPIWHWNRGEEADSTSSCALRFESEDAWLVSLQKVASDFLNSYERDHNWYDKDLSELDFIEGTQPFGDLTVAWLIGKQFMPTAESFILALPGECPGSRRADPAECDQPDAPHKSQTASGVLSLLSVGQRFTRRKFVKMAASWLTSQAGAKVMRDVRLRKFADALKGLAQAHPEAGISRRVTSTYEIGTDRCDAHVKPFDAWEYPCWSDGGLRSHCLVISRAR